MPIFFPATIDPDEKALYTVDWTDEMDATTDTITGTPTFVFDDASVYGMRITGVAIATGSKKVTFFIDNSDAATNRADVLANSPYAITHTVSTTAGQTLTRHLIVGVDEEGGALDVTVSGATSDSYGTLLEADTFMNSRGYTWGGTDQSRVQKLRRGTAALDERFRMRLQGMKTTSGQALAWPRFGVADEDGNQIASDTIPEAVKRAQFEMSRIISMDMVATGGQAIRSAGAGSARVVFSTSYLVDTTLTHVDRLMAPYLKSTNRLVRA